VADQLQRLEGRVADLEGVIAGLQRRLQALEAGLSPVAARDAVVALAAETHVSRAADLAAVMTLAGRTCVIFAGAYLLRALTEWAVIDRAAGASIGIVYAALWSAAAYRAAPGHSLSATFFGASTVLVGFPLVWETTTRFATLSPASASAVLAGLTLIVLATAWRWHLRLLAWLATITACILAVVLLAATSQPVPFAIFLTALGIGTLWLGYESQWSGLPWVTASFADFAVLGLLSRAIATPPRDAPWLVVTVQLLLLVGYLASIAVRTLVRARAVTAFELSQTAAILLAGLAGAIVIVNNADRGTLWIGMAATALSVGCYAVALIERHPIPAGNRCFYSTLALVFALTGSALLFDRVPLVAALCSLAVFAARHRRGVADGTLAVHSAVYLIAAAVASGLASATLAGMFAPKATHPLTASAWIVLFALGASWWSVSARAEGTNRRLAAVLRLVWAALVTWTSAGVLLLVTPWSTTLLDGDAPAGMMATLRTALLAAVAVLAGVLGRWPSTREFGWLVYPILAWGGVKLLVEDFRSSSPLLLFAGLATYGGALIVGPRLAQGAQPVRPETAAVGRNDVDNGVARSTST
jgi:hypothetical protein